MTQTKANIICVFIVIKHIRRIQSPLSGEYKGNLRKYFENYFKAILTVNRETSKNHKTMATSML